MLQNQLKTKYQIKAELLKLQTQTDLEILINEQQLETRNQKLLHQKQQEYSKVLASKQKEHFKKQQELEIRLHWREFREEVAKREREWLRIKQNELKNIEDKKKQKDYMEEQRNARKNQLIQEENSIFRKIKRKI